MAETKTMLECEREILNFVFHHWNEEWFPAKTTYGQWLKDIYQLMLDRDYFSRHDIWPKELPDA